MARLLNIVCIITVIQLLKSIPCCNSQSAITPPLPLLPIPTASQLKWQQRELIMFFHFGMNTFTDSEWGSGQENPNLFKPSALNASQWVSTAAEAGFSLVILTAKHHDGFCLWPSKYTNHSVASSPWRKGKGDVVAELVHAAKANSHVDVGLYLSPWDRHDQRYGKNDEYNEYYMGQLRELLKQYGSVEEIWFDGAKAPDAVNMSYYFEEWFGTVKQLQASINIFSDAGPDLRWVGNEVAAAGNVSWSTINRTALSIGAGADLDYLNTGDPHGTDWIPPECDVSLRPGWFWHASEQPKELADLLDIYYNSVGRNCVLLFNVPPNSTGLISETDVHRLREFRKAIDTTFSTNLAENGTIKASSQRGGRDGGFGPENVLDDDHLWTYWAPAPREEEKGQHWIEIKAAGGGMKFNVIRIQEAIGLGQRIIEHEIYADGKLIAGGATVGHKRLHKLGEVVEAESVKVKISESRGVPLISSFGLHFDPFGLTNGTSLYKSSSL